MISISKKNLFNKQSNDFSHQITAKEQKKLRYFKLYINQFN